ncbi:hypothetical protein [Blastococcus atacamensis]|uniref:hypothetical protein n=1 Tax=Blastococcus atacamensis TaxID=2070508 RepID=UPI00130006C7|nr:hypothetical protein [Blastococcus atacamensis]
MSAISAPRGRRTDAPGGRTRQRSAVDPVDEAAARWLATATAVLAADIVVVALLGPLVTGVIDYRVSPLLAHQLMGADAVSLAVITPLTLLAAWLFRRRSPHGPLLALGTALAAWYFAAELVLGPDRLGRPGNDEAFFPLFLSVLLLSAAVAIGAWRALPTTAVSLGRRSRAVIGSLLLIIVALFVLGRYLPAWLSIVDGTPSADYVAGPSVWWTVAFEDLALLLPAAAAAGIGLLRRARWAGIAAFAVSGCLALIGVAVAAMAWSNNWHGDPGSTPGTAMAMTFIGVLTAVPAIVCWTAIAGGVTSGPLGSSAAERG